MQGKIQNRGPSKFTDVKMFWHLFTDMDNQFVEALDVFPPARMVEKAERNMVAVVKVPEISPGESFSPTVVLRIDTIARDWLLEPRSTNDIDEKQIRGTYSSMLKYWEIDDPSIQELSQSIAEKSTNDESYARLAFSVVQKQVKLKTHLDVRLGAAKAAIEKEGDCDEHADLFIALARAVKIPARRVVGHFLKRGPEPEPHAWCEVFLSNIGWIPVDPALNRFGALSENYFSRIREGLVSERPTIQLKMNKAGASQPLIEENVKMSILESNRD
ncbi:MAG: transglutaminase-like domain-containing protein [Candidatus Thorarchaeota archaeon]|jgi:transglutaminase-like putative cysteine protease